MQTILQVMTTMMPAAAPAGSPRGVERRFESFRTSSVAENITYLWIYYRILKKIRCIEMNQLKMVI